MRRQLASFSLILCGLCCMIGSLGALIDAPVVSAMPILAPSPRPPIDHPDPTDPQQPAEESSGSHKESGSAPKAVATGRVTGTIIDATTGAPVSGVLVRVGDVQIASDANGNYDTWLPVGAYTVDLVLTSQQGTDVQGAQSIEVRAGDTTVQHLYFRSALAPTATVQAVPVPTLVQSAPPVDTLPNTSVASSKADQIASRPAHLPHTSVPQDSSLLWLSLGMILVVCGAIVGFTTKRSLSRAGRATARIDDKALLLALLAEPSPLSSDEGLLLALLAE